MVTPSSRVVLLICSIAVVSILTFCSPTAKQALSPQTSSPQASSPQTSSPQTSHIQPVKIQRTENGPVIKGLFDLSKQRPMPHWNCPNGVSCGMGAAKGPFPVCGEMSKPQSAMCQTMPTCPSSSCGASLKAQCCGGGCVQLAAPCNGCPTVGRCVNQ